MDLFGFSIPYLAEQVTTMLFSIVGKSGALDKLATSMKHPEEKDNIKKMLDAAKLSDEEKVKQERREALRNKIKAVARLHRIFSNLR
jgi:hypothetical protein